MAIKEKVKTYIAERNARDGAAGSGLGEANTPSTPATRLSLRKVPMALAKALLKTG